MNKYEFYTSNKKFYSIVRGSRNFVQEWLGQRCRNRKALDYACGNGYYAIFVAKNGAKAIGIDISDVSIKNCKQRAIREGVDKIASFFVMDAEALQFDNDCFDIICVSGSLHHLDIQKAYFELARVLKPDGAIICAEPLRTIQPYTSIEKLHRIYEPSLRQSIFCVREIWKWLKVILAKLTLDFFIWLPWRRCLAENYQHFILH